MSPNRLRASRQIHSPSGRRKRLMVRSQLRKTYFVKSNAAPADSTSSLPPDTEQQWDDFLQNIGFTDFYNNVLQPLINDLANNPYLTTLFSGIDPYLTDSTFGQTTKMLNQSFGGTGSLYQQGGPRSTQFSIRLVF